MTRSWIAMALSVCLLSTSTLAFATPPTAAMSAQDKKALDGANSKFGFALILTMEVGALVFCAAGASVAVAAVGVTLVLAPVVLGAAMLISPRLQARVMHLLGGPDPNAGANVARSAPSTAPPRAASPQPADAGFRH